MKTVNPYFLHRLLDPLSGLADDDESVEKYATLDPNDEESVRQVIRHLLVPHFRSLSADCVVRIRLAYQYYLTKESSNFERVYESILPPFDPPNDPRMFFVWVWEECFPGEAFELEDVSDIVESPDINEPLEI